MTRQREKEVEVRWQVDGSENSENGHGMSNVPFRETHQGNTTCRWRRRGKRNLASKETSEFANRITQ